MKHYYYLLITVLCVFFGTGAVKAQAYWANDDFSSQVWQEVVENWISVWNESNPGIVFPSTPDAMVGFPTGSIIGQYEFEGAYIRSTAAMEALPCAEGGGTHKYAFRLRSSAISHLTLPEVENAGKLILHVRNANSTATTTITLQKEDGADNWVNVNTKTLKKNNDYSKVIDEIITWEINSASPIRLRINRGDKFIYIFKLLLEKNGVPSSVKSLYADGVDVYVSGKTAFISGEVSNAVLSLYDFSGREILNAGISGNRVSLDGVQEGVYILKMASSEGTLTKKIIVE
jgi:hypothetical protein